MTCFFQSIVCSGDEAEGVMEMKWEVC